MFVWIFSDSTPANTQMAAAAAATPPPIPDRTKKYHPSFRLPLRPPPIQLPPETHAPVVISTEATDGVADDASILLRSLKHLSVAGNDMMGTPPATREPLSLARLTQPVRDQWREEYQQDMGASVTETATVETTAAAAATASAAGEPAVDTEPEGATPTLPLKLETMYENGTETGGETPKLTHFIGDHSNPQITWCESVLFCVAMLLLTIAAVIHLYSEYHHHPSQTTATVETVGCDAKQIAAAVSCTFGAPR